MDHGMCRTGVEEDVSRFIDPTSMHPTLANESTNVNSQPAKGADENCAVEVVYKSPSLIVIRHKDKEEDAQISFDAGQGIHCEQNPSTTSKIQEKLTQMWTEQKLCDMALLMSDGQMLVHKVVFAAHSKKLVQDFQKYPPGKVLYINLKDFEPKSVFDLTQYLYTGKLTLSNKNVAPLLKLANELGITGLHEKSREFFGSYDINNALSFLVMFQEAGMTKLAEEVMQYIFMHFNEIANTSDFLDTPISLLLALFSSDCLCVMSELEVFYAVVKWLDVNRADRMKHAEALLKCVRFRLLDPEVIATKVERVDWIFHSKSCKTILSDAYK